MDYNLEDLPVVFINIKHRTDRLTHIVDQLNKYKFKNINRFNAHYIPKNGHLGCAKSHLGVIDFAIEKDFEQILILEDDFEFIHDVDFTHKILINIIDQNWDVVLLTHLWGKEHKSESNFLKKIKLAQTSPAYLVKKNYYCKLKNMLQYCINNMSDQCTSETGREPLALDQQWKKLQEEDNWFVANPKLGNQKKELISTIQSTTNYNMSNKEPNVRKKC